MPSNHNYECFNGGCHGMAANDQGFAFVWVIANVKPKPERTKV